MKFRVFQAAVLACPLVAQAAADPVELDDVVVTETRTARSVDDLLASVTVITRAQIEDLQAQSLADVLRGLPGVSLSNAGGAGKLTSLFLRGTESDHVLVLIDGVRVNSPAFGGAALQDIPVGQIERIEVVRGPRSSLYGADAIGGVIQIFTRGGGRDLQVTGSIGGGSYGTLNGDIGAAGEAAGIRYGAHLAAADTDGFNACSGDPDLGAGCFKNEPDDDGYRNLSGAVRLGYSFGDAVDLDLHALRADSQVDYDGDFGNSTDTVQQTLGARLKWALQPGLQLTVAGGQSREDADTYQDGAFFSSIDTRIDTASLQSDVGIGPDHLLTVGADYAGAHVGGTTQYDVDSRDDVGVFGQYQGVLGHNDLRVSVRWDDDQAFGEHSTGTVGWGRRVGADVRLTASAGTAFKAPTFNELYFPGFSNPDLAPEESSSVELGVAGRLAAAHWALNAYQTDIDNLIAFDLTTFTLDNVDRARIRGLEASLNGELAGFDIGGGLTWLDPVNRSGGDNDGNVLPRRAQQSLRLDVARQLGHLQLGGTLVAQGRRFDDLGNTRRLPGYATLDLRAAYDLLRNWQLQASVVNVLDKAYETAEFFNQPGRSAYLTVRYQY